MEHTFTLGVSIEDMGGTQHVVFFVDDTEAFRYAPGTGDRERALQDAKMRMVAVMRQLFIGWSDDR